MRTFELNDLEWVHFVAACLSLVLGPLILCMKKGTPSHVRVGYLYTVSMLVVNIPVFFTYELFGGFGIFHAFAVVSLVSLGYGMGAAIVRRPRKHWLRLHLSGMYWSVMGLYFAGFAQVMVSFRWSGTQVMIAAGILAAISTYLFVRYRQAWGRVPAKAFRAG